MVLHQPRGAAGPWPRFGHVSPLVVHPGGLFRAPGEILPSAASPGLGVGPPAPLLQPAHQRVPFGLLVNDGQGTVGHPGVGLGREAPATGSAGSGPADGTGPPRT